MFRVNNHLAFIGQRADDLGVGTVAKDTKKHDWNKEQPHHVDTGRITKEKYARDHPNKVEWVKEKK